MGKLYLYELYRMEIRMPIIFTDISGLSPIFNILQRGIYFNEDTSCVRITMLQTYVVGTFFALKNSQYHRTEVSSLPNLYNTLLIKLE